MTHILPASGWTATGSPGAVTQYKFKSKAGPIRTVVVRNGKVMKATVEEVGRGVSSIKPGQFVIGSLVAEGYRAMSERRAIKALLQP